MNTQPMKMVVPARLTRMLTTVSSPVRLTRMLTTASSTIATLMLLWSVISQYLPYELHNIIQKLKLSLNDFLNPYVKITINEFRDLAMSSRRNEVYVAVEAYLSTIINSKTSKRLKADMESYYSNLVLTMDEFQTINDEFQGAKLEWVSGKFPSKTSSSNRYYKLIFHKNYRELVTKLYLEHVIKEGKDIRKKNRPRWIYTNVFKSSASYSWVCSVFNHPASFETMAMDEEKKKEIVEDLLAFSKGKDYYARIGKAWKRGYLLYGPPGTGKSTLIASMAKLLSYDVYDLELTAVKDNTELRKLLIETTRKSIIVIEDIDCSLQLTGERKKKDSCLEDQEKTEKVGENRVTLSGLLNFIDGLWSSGCEGERIIVFTTNHVENLDKALIRRGRMDMHIELSYCSFEGFKVLAKNYLRIETHQMFDEIERLIREVKITPADVAENLMPKKTSLDDDDDPAEQCLSNLIGVLENVKEKADAKKKLSKAATDQTVESKAMEEEEAATQNMESKENEPNSKESKTSSY